MFGKRLRELRERNTYSMDKLIALYNAKFNGKMNKSTLSRYENGLQEPMYTVVANLAELFSVSVDYILGRTNEASPSTPPKHAPTITEDFTSFPVIGEVAAGYDHIVAEDWEGEKIDVPNSYLKGRPKESYFVLKVKGDSMYPAYQDGDRVLVLKQETLNYSGQVGVVLYGDDNATLKKVEFKMGEDWMRLIPINPAFPPIRIEGEDLTHCRVLGIPRLLVREIQE